MIRNLFLVVLLALATTAAAQPDALTFTLGPVEPIGASDIAHSFGVLHNSGLDIQNVTVQVDLIGPRTAYVGGQNDANWTCSNGVTPYVLFCTTPLIRANESQTLQIYAGPVRETRVLLSAQASWQNFEQTLYSPVSRRIGRFAREFIVSNSGDAGHGSLRSAIEASNEECARDQVPCDIVFHIGAPAPEQGWYTIYPNTPLPAITAPDIGIDGATQTRFGGDTNPLGPEIALDGSALGIGHGLRLAGAGFASVSNLAIGGFPWNGIAVTRNSDAGSKIEGNYIGTDPTGTHAHPNRSRGITFDLPASDYEVTRNIISSNGRSGVFVASAYRLSFEENIIRLNGASGVFLGDEASEISLRRNTIADNTWFGVAISRQAARFELIENSITRNGFIGIDRGLDGFSGYDRDETDIFNVHVPPARLLSALYDPAANRTTITGTYFPEFENYGSWGIALYASTVNDGQGETWLGTTTTTNGTFAFHAPGDLRGQFITSLGQHSVHYDLASRYFWTSEFSEPIEVR